MSTRHPIIVKHLIYPLNEFIFGRQTFKCLKELEKTQWYSPDEIQHLQWLKLKNLLSHAYENVPYYRRVFNELNMTPDDIKGLANLNKIPFLTKENIKANFNDLTAKNYKGKLKRMTTGGSTGEPLIFLVDKNRVSYDIAARFRSRRWWNVEIGEREIVLWGSPIELSVQNGLREIRDKLVNSQLLSAFNLTEESLAKYARIIINYHPASIFGYPSAIYFLCQFINENRIDLKNIKIKAIFTTGEVLYDFQRDLIQSTFKTKVANGYGGRDAGFVAHECPQGNIHINQDHLIVEFLPQEAAGYVEESGEIIVTDLTNYGMPFIRYKTGDIGQPYKEKCSCGRGLPLMKIVEGRVHDYIVTKEGKGIYGGFFAYVLRDLNGVNKFKVIQKSVDEILVKIVKTDKFEPQNVDYIKTKYKEMMGENTNISVDFVDNIPPDKSGKHRYILSEVASKYLNPNKE